MSSQPTRLATGDHALGTFSLANELLTARADVQPHLAGKLGVFCGGGSTLSGRFFRDASCLIVATLEACYDGINARRTKPNPITASPEALYEFVTGKRVAAGEPMPVSLQQAEKAFAELHIRVTAIDHLGRVVYRYEGKNWARGRVLRLGVKNNHCWLVNDNVDSFDHTYAEKAVTDLAPLSTDLSKELPTTWGFAPKEPAEVVAICQTADEVVAALSAVPAGCAKKRSIRIVVAGEDFEAVAVGVRKLGYEPSDIDCVHGAVDSFKIKHGNTIARVTHTVEKAARTDDQPAPDAPTIEAVTRLNAGLSNNMR